MKFPIRYTVSFFEKRIKVFRSSSTKSLGEAVVSGYSCVSSTNRQKPLSESCERRLAGIFYADIADHRRLTEQGEEGTHLHLVEAMNLMKAQVIADNGHIAYLTDGAILAEFKDADSALHCAINVHLAARQWNATLGLESQIGFRIGVNFGEAIADHDDIYGNAVNLAVRLDGLSCSGGICVSDTVRTELANKSAFKFVAMGKRHVKNIRKPVETFWIEFDQRQIVNTEQKDVVMISSAAS